MVTGCVPEDKGFAPRRAGRDAPSAGATDDPRRSRDAAAKRRRRPAQAITPFTDVRFDNKGTLLLSDSARAAASKTARGTFAVAASTRPARSIVAASTRPARSIFGRESSASQATAMGEYYFADAGDGITKAEYTFQYRRAADGSLKIIVHHSSIPFQA